VAVEAKTLAADDLIRRAVRSGLRRARRRQPREDQRVRLLRERGIDVVLDVGANEGLYALRLRTAGYRGRIVSFEPLSAMFAKLADASADDPDWEALRVALGAEPGTATLNIAGNWASSSLLPMRERHRLAEPRSAYVAAEECAVATLDGLREEVLRPDERAYLKLDVQGSELDVLRGGARTLEQIEIVQAETSLVPLYDGAPLFGEVVAYLDEREFSLVAVEPAFVHPATGAILQLDGLFTRVP
jgi:FkbM family methyltransferase